MNGNTYMNMSWTDVVALLRCSRYSLGVVASSRGLIAGRLIFQVSHDIANRSLMDLCIPFLGEMLRVLYWEWWNVPRQCLMKQCNYCLLHISIIHVYCIGTRQRDCGLLCMWIFRACNFWWPEYVTELRIKGRCTVHYNCGKGEILIGTLVYSYFSEKPTNYVTVF